MYKIILSLRSNLSGPDTCHIWFQEPMRFEDAYGRVWPIPVEYDFAMMEGALQGKFRKGPGKKRVEKGLWQLTVQRSKFAIGEQLGTRSKNENHNGDDSATNR